MVPYSMPLLNSSELAVEAGTMIGTAAPTSSAGAYRR